MDVVKKSEVELFYNVFCFYVVRFVKIEKVLQHSWLFESNSRFNVGAML